jgi:hypothetical protein
MAQSGLNWCSQLHHVVNLLLFSCRNGGCCFSSSLLVEMEPSQKHTLELVLRYFYIPYDVHLTVTDRLRFDWLLQQPLASWQFLTLQEFRSRDLVPPNMFERLYE